jgi:hypothetical protein
MILKIHTPYATLDLREDTSSTTKDITLLAGDI